jgi:hypothetical protein
METVATHPPTKMTLQEALFVLIEITSQQNINHFRIGQVYNYAVAEKLAEKHANKSAAEYFCEHIKALSQTALSICGTVANAFTDGACARYGVYNLYALISYAKAANIQLSKEEPGPTPIAVPKEDGSVETKAFADCTVEELKRATKHKRPKKGAEPSEQEQIRIQALKDSFARHFAEASSRTRVNSRVYMGKSYVTLQDVPVTELERLAEALADGLTAATRAQ